MKLILFLLFLFVVRSMHAQTARIEWPKTAEPLIFASGFISDGLDNRDFTISPDGNELYFTIQHRIQSVIMRSVKKGQTWSEPEVAFFSGRFNDLEASFSPDGGRIYFSSNRPLSDTGTLTKDFDIWCVEKKEDKWTGPFNLGTVVNTSKDEFYPSVAKSGNLYFTCDNGKTREDLFVSTYQSGQYFAPVALPETVNSEGFDFNAFIDPDESFIIFTSYKRKDDKGGGDLYISKKAGGNWLPAKHLGGINSTAIDYCPYVSPDKRYFFFTSKRMAGAANRKTTVTAKELKKKLTSAGNGSDDIYVMDFDVIEQVLESFH